MKLYKKIDIYMLNGDGKSPNTFVYICSTNQSKTCKEAKKKFADHFWRFKPSARDESLIKANFAK